VRGFRLRRGDWERALSSFLLFRSVRRIADDTGVSRRHVQEIAHHVRSRMILEVPPAFSGPVEIDETYIGAQRKNQRLHIRKLHPPKRGHGTRKLPIFGIFDRATGLAFVEVMPRKLDVSHILMRAQQRIAPGARVYTDGFPTYRQLARLGYAHEWVDHNAREYVRGDVHTNNIEGFWGIMKRTMGATGGMRRDRLHLFAAEIAWRFNHRKETPEQKGRALLRLVLDE
jgi:transposase-like protein